MTGPSPSKNFNLTLSPAIADPARTPFNSPEKACDSFDPKIALQDHLQETISPYVEEASQMIKMQIYQKSFYEEQKHGIISPPRKSCIFS